MSVKRWILIQDFCRFCKGKFPALAPIRWMGDCYMRPNPINQHIFLEFCLWRRMGNQFQWFLQQNYLYIFWIKTFFNILCGKVTNIQQVSSHQLPSVKWGFTQFICKNCINSHILMDHIFLLIASEEANYETRWNLERLLFLLSPVPTGTQKLGLARIQLAIFFLFLFYWFQAYKAT